MQPLPFRLWKEISAILVSFMMRNHRVELPSHAALRFCKVDQCTPLQCTLDGLMRGNLPDGWMSRGYYERKISQLALYSFQNLMCCCDLSILNLFHVVGNGYRSRWFGCPDK